MFFDAKITHVLSSRKNGSLLFTNLVRLGKFNLFGTAYQVTSNFKRENIFENINIFLALIQMKG
jgi:hypothetical protein